MNEGEKISQLQELVPKILSNPTATRGPEINSVFSSPERLQEMEIDELYRYINSQLDKGGTIDKFRNHVAFKTALVMGWIEAIKAANSLEGASYQEINAKITKQAEGKFLDSLARLGVNVEIRSELSEEELAQRPHLFLSTHQGGGLETYLLAELMRRGGVEQFRYVMKDDNVKLPLVGKTIASRGPILVNRKNLRENRGREIIGIAEEIVKSLADGENVLFFFEGTRSKNGLIAHTEKRQEWGTQLSESITLAAKNYPGLDYGKVLVVLDMLSVLPEAVEKKPFGKVRMNGDCTATMVKADDLSFEMDETNNHDQTTVFGKARAILKNRLIERIQRY